MYVGNAKNDTPEFLASSLLLNERIAECVIRGAMSDVPNRSMYMAWDEWNVWYRARGQGKEKGRDILEEHYNLEDALVVSTFLNTFINNAHVVKIANMAQLVNVVAPIFTSKLSEVNGPDVKAMNTFGSTVVKTMSKSVDVSGARLRYSFPPHSFTMLKGKVA
jgi:alpha-L-arabinofuranosidase